MTDVTVTIAIVGAFLLVIEIVRWKFRPEERRLRVIKKLGGGR